MESEGSHDWHGAAPDGIQAPIQLRYLSGPVGAGQAGPPNHGPLTHGIALTAVEGVARGIRLPQPAPPPTKARPARRATRKGDQ